MRKTVVVSREVDRESGVICTIAGKRNPQSIIATPHKNIPHGAVSEESVLSGVSRWRKKSVLRYWSDQVRWGRARRIVINGMPYFIPVQEAQV